jgi:hypothetical protein
MIIANGTIEIKIKGAMEQDSATGFYAPTQSTWGTPIACQYTLSNSTLDVQSNGESYTTAHYSILIEECRLPEAFEQLRLKDNAGRVIGEFSLLSVPEVLAAVGQIRLLI